MQNLHFFDGHNDVLTRLWLSSSKDPVNDFIHSTLDGHLDLKRCLETGWYGGLFSIFLPPYHYVQKHHPEKLFDLHATDFNAQQIKEICLKQLEFAIELQSKSLNQIKICTSISEIKDCYQKNMLAIVLHMEGAEVLENNIELLDVFYDAGLRSIGPLWNRKTKFGDGLNASFPHSPDTGLGLSYAGKELIRKCTSKKMLIDVSHMNEKAFWDTVELLDQPIVATHSNVHAICPQARNLTKDQLIAIRESQGLVGVNFDVAFLRPDGQRNSDTSLDIIVDHIEYLLDVLGEDGVGLGSDFDGAMIPQKMKDVTGLHLLVKKIESRNFSSELIQKICSENWLNALNTIWGK